MALTSDQVSVLVRLQHAAEGVRDSARAVASAQGHAQLGHVGEQVKTLIDQVRVLLKGVEPEGAEFEALFPQEGSVFWRDAEPRASAFAGWLRGAVEASVLTARIEAEARAYAAARVKDERSIGFGQRDSA